MYENRMAQSSSLSYYYSDVSEPIHNKILLMSSPMLSKTNTAKELCYPVLKDRDSTVNGGLSF